LRVEEAEAVPAESVRHRIEINRISFTTKRGCTFWTAPFYFVKIPK
jgi:hypothetical protein